MTTSKLTRVIQIVVQGTGELKRVARGFSSLRKDVSKTRGSLDLMKNAFLGFAGIATLRTIASMSDQFQLLENRIESFTGSAEVATDVMAQLREMATETNTSVAALGEAFSRISLATTDFGLSTDSVLFVTRQLQQTFRLSGATIAETRASLIQLGQGLSSGAVRGQELRSVLEQNAVLAGLFAKKLGIGRGELIKWSEKFGGIKADVVFDVLLESADELNLRASKLAPTFEQTFVKIKDALRSTISEFNKDFNLSTNFAKAGLQISKTVDFIGFNLKALIKTFQEGDAFIGIMSGSLLALVATTGPLGATIAGFTALGIAISELSKLPDFFDKRQTENAKEQLGVRESTLKSMVSEAKIRRDMYGSTIKSELAIARAEAKLKAFQKLNRAGDRSLPTDAEFRRQQEIKNARQLDELRRKRLTKEKEAFKALRAGYGAYKKSIFDIDKTIATLQAAELKKLDATFKKNKSKDVLKYASAVQKVKDKFEGVAFDYKMDKLNKEFNKTGDVEKYVTAVKSLELEKLNSDIAKGNVLLTDKNRILGQTNEKLLEIRANADPSSLSIGIEKGLKDYAKAVGTLTDGIAKVVVRAFDGLEDALVDFVNTGKLEFRKMVDAIAQDLLRLSIRMAITKPLASAFIPSAKQAQGGAWNNGVQAFASGGVISSPTLFPMRGGTGLMGEKGPEAIAPLRRTSSGDLGIQAVTPQVTVNVNNLAANDTEVQVTESQDKQGVRVLEVMIAKKTSDSFATGKMDRIMSQRYGLRARGA